MTEWGYEVSSESLDHFIALDGNINPECDSPSLMPACITELAWLSMRSRCSCDPFYTTRGISVCSDWSRSLASFIEHAGHRPSKDHCLHRIDNEKGYEPGNVMWLTKSAHSKTHASARRMHKEGVIS